MNVAISDFARRSPLHVACSLGHSELVRYLLGRGALIHEMDLAGHTPLWNAVEARAHDAVRLIVQTGGFLRPPLERVGAAMSCAAASGDVKLLRALLLAGAQVDQLNPEGSTALHLVCPAIRSGTFANEKNYTHRELQD